MRNILIASAAALTLAAATPAAALDDVFANRLNVPHDQWLPATKIADHPRSG